MICKGCDLSSERALCMWRCLSFISVVILQGLVSIEYQFSAPSSEGQMYPCG